MGLNPYKPGVLFMGHRQIKRPRCDAAKRGVPSEAILFSSKNEIKIKFTPDSLKNENGLIQMIRMENSIRPRWVNLCKIHGVT